MDWNLRFLRFRSVIVDAVEFTAQASGVKPTQVAEVSRFEAAATFPFSRSAAASFDPQPNIMVQNDLTDALLDGIQRLKKEPFSTWEEKERDGFLWANHALLHEAGHLTIPRQSPEAVAAEKSLPLVLREALAELGALGLQREFVAREYGIPWEDWPLARSNNYRPFVDRLALLLERAGAKSVEAQSALARKLGDATPGQEVLNELARLIAPNATPGQRAEIASAVPAYLDGSDTETLSQLLRGDPS